jgi:hypothetical protein
MGNQRLFLAVALGAVFLATVVVTTIVLVNWIVPRPEIAALRERAEPTQTSPMRVDRPSDLETGVRAGNAGDEAWRGADRPVGGGGWGAAPDVGRAGPSGLDASAERSIGGTDTGQWSSSRGASRWSQGETYRFRPLDARERARLEQQGPGSWSGAERGSWSRDPGVGVWSAPTEGFPQGFGGEWETAPYRFRPVDPPSPPPDRRRAIPSLQEPGWQLDSPLFDPAPQWGAMPPDRPMPLPDLYPSLNPDADRRLTQL